MEHLQSDNEKLLARFPPILRENFKELCSADQIGLYPLPITNIEDSKRYTEEEGTYSYYFVLAIQYSVKPLKWELIFEPEDFSFPPDVTFTDEGFPMATEVDNIIANVPSLFTWDVRNPKSLISLLRDFLDLYKKQQIEFLQTKPIFSQICEEYNQLAEMVPLQDIEVYTEGAIVGVLVNIRVDSSELPPYPQFSRVCNPGEGDDSLLEIVFEVTTYTTVQTNIRLSPLLKSVFGTVDLPHYGADNSLANYVMHVTKLMNQWTEDVSCLLEMKREFIVRLYSSHYTNVVEFDADNFSSIKLLCEVDDYLCLVGFHIGVQFPREPPLVQLFSLYCVSRSVCSRELQFSYDATWLPERMIREIFASLKTYIPVFKNHEH